MENNMFGSFNLIGWFICLLCSCWADNIPSKKLYIKKIDPHLFDWSGHDITEPLEDSIQFSYRPSLLNAPDLPSWIYYTASGQFNHGFLYGSPPNQLREYQIEIIGLNRKTYETRRRIIKISVDKLSDPAAFNVELKLDRVSVEEMLSDSRHQTLLDVFRRDLWPESAPDLQISFLASAVELGARLPLDPNYGEGVVVKIGSSSKFSQTLMDLQTETRPLRTKGKNCPDFKHTSVERYFKQYNFSLDWCAFQLERLDVQLPQDIQLPLTQVLWMLFIWGFEVEREPLEPRVPVQISAGRKAWRPVKKSELPTRNYGRELGLVIITPVLGFTVLVALLTFIFCVQDGEEHETSPDQLVQYEAVQRAGNTLRSMSAQRDTSTTESSPRVSMERTGLRPNPPPYSGVHHVTRDEYFDDEEAKTWYC